MLNIESTAQKTVTTGQRNYIFVLLFILLLCDQADRLVVLEPGTTTVI